MPNLMPKACPCGVQGPCCAGVRGEILTSMGLDDAPKVITRDCVLCYFCWMVRHDLCRAVVGTPIRCDCDCHD